MSKPKFGFLMIAYQTHRPLFYVMIPLLLISYLIGSLYFNLDPLLFLFPSGENEASFQFLEGAIIVTAAAVGGFLIIFALKKHLLSILKVFFAVSFLISSVSILWLHGYIIEITFLSDVIWVEILLATFGGIIGLTAIYTLILDKGSTLVKNVVIFLLGIVMGTIFGLVFSIITFLTFIILLSLFDIYSVFKGPISKIFEKQNLSLSSNPPMIKKRSIAIGVGDFIFYSSLVTFISKEFGLLLGFSSIIGILVGIKITESFLFRYGKFPGLPIPVFLSLFLLLVGWLAAKYLLRILP